MKYSHRLVIFSYIHAHIYTCMCTHTYIHRYHFSHNSHFIKHTDLSMKLTCPPGIRARQLLAIHTVLNDSRMRISLQCRSRKISLLEYQSRERENPLCHTHANTLRENNCLQVAFIASHQNPGSLQKDNAFSVSLLLSHVSMDMQWNKQSVSKSSSNQSVRQHKQCYCWVVKSQKILCCRIQRLTEEMYLENKRGICRTLRYNRFPVST